MDLKWDSESPNIVTRIRFSFLARQLLHRPVCFSASLSPAKLNAVMSMLLIVALVPLYLWRCRQNSQSLGEHEDETQTHKCVPLEDLAAEFKLRTQECINRINSLEEMGRLSGVMDDRGKYIYISLEEMNAVAEYIKCVGRVSISHLAGKSDQFIDLKPKTQVVEDGVSLEEIAVA